MFAETTAAVAVPPAAPPPPAGSNISSAGNLAVSPPAPATTHASTHASSSSSPADSRLPRRKVAEQRDRMKNISIMEIAPYLHMSKEAAAKKLDISSSSLTRLCRMNKLARWPGRRVRQNSVDMLFPV